MNSIELAQSTSPPSSGAPHAKTEAMALVNAGLSNALANRALIVVLGPQIDRESGLPSLDQVARACVAQARELEPEELEGADELIERGELGQAFERAQFVLGRAQFRRAVVDELSRDFRVPKLLDAIAQLRDQLRALYATSLVDGLYNRALRGRWPIYDEARPHLAQREGLVFHLRGTLTRPDGWVLSESQTQRELSPSSARGKLLATVYKAHHLLLLGFDPEGPELRAFLHTLPTLEGAEVPEHYIALEGGCAAQTRRQLGRRGFQVLDSGAESLLLDLGGRSETDDPNDPNDPNDELPACPYPGLETFGEDLTKLFFGRHVEVSRATARLGASEDGPPRRWLFVEGASGVGKSSFVHAGVVPAMRRGFVSGAPSRWVVARMRPGQEPLTNLVDAILTALDRQGAARRTLAPSRLTDNPELLTEFIADHTPEGHALLLVVDQFEESATIARESERAAFTTCLGALLDAEAAWMLTTVRSDFVPSVQARLPGFSALLNDRAERYVLPPISRVGLREIIVEPAARAGVTIEPELLETMLADADPEGEVDEHGEVRSATAALPLVAHMLRRMWDSGAAEDRLMELAEYRALGGVRGGISHSAEALLATLDADQIECVEALFLGLARVERDGSVTRRPIARACAIEFAGGGEAGEQLLALLSGGDEDSLARLLTVREGPQGDQVDLVHEALLRDWDRCRQWFEANFDELILREQLARRTQFWLDAGQPSEGLPVGEELEMLLRAQPSGDEREPQERFVAALRQHERMRKLSLGVRWLTVLASLALIGVVVTLGLLGKTKEEVTKAKEETEEKVEEAVETAVEEAKDETKDEIKRLENELAQKQGFIDQLMTNIKWLRTGLDIDPCALEESQQEATIGFGSGEVVFNIPPERVSERLCSIANNKFDVEPKSYVLVYGYTDPVRSTELGNDQLSWGRAVAVKSHLASLGVPKERIEVVAGGVHPDPEPRAHDRSRIVKVEVLTENVLEQRVRQKRKQGQAYDACEQGSWGARYACYEQRDNDARNKERLESTGEPVPKMMSLNPNFKFPTDGL